MAVILAQAKMVDARELATTIAAAFERGYLDLEVYNIRDGLVRRTYGWCA